MSFNKLIKNITLNTFDSTIDQEDLPEEIQKVWMDDETFQIDGNSKNLINFLKRDYFYPVEEIELERFEKLDSLKVRLFLFLIMRDDKQRQINCFTNIIKKEMEKEDTYSLSSHQRYDAGDNSVSTKRDAPQKIIFHKDDPKTIEVLSYLFAGAIIPFVDYYESQYGSSGEEFKKFKTSATTNYYVFVSFSQFYADKYIFGQTTRGINCKLFT